MRPVSPRAPVGRRLTAVALGALSAVVASSCGNGDRGDEAAPTTVRVAATMFPLEEIVRGVAGTALGTAVTLVQVVAPGDPAHDAEPTARQLEALETADVVVHLGGGFQPDIERAIEALPADVTVIDLLDSVDVLPVVDPVAGTDDGHGDDGHGDDGHGDDGHGHESTAGDVDPHVWLSPDRMASMAAAVASVLEQRLAAIGLDDRAAEVTTGLEGFVTEMRALDDEFSDGLALCESSVIVTAHRAFAYLAASFGLTQASIAGISPSEEPSAATLEAVAEFARANGVTTIFFEERLPADLARTVADEIGAEIAVLDPIESPSAERLADGATYSSIMRDNLVALREALRCA